MITIHLWLRIDFVILLPIFLIVRLVPIEVCLRTLWQRRCCP